MVLPSGERAKEVTSSPWGRGGVLPDPSQRPRIERPCHRNRPGSGHRVRIATDTPAGCGHATSARCRFGRPLRKEAGRRYDQFSGDRLSWLHARPPEPAALGRPPATGLCAKRSDPSQSGRHGNSQDYGEFNLAHTHGFHACLGKGEDTCGNSSLCFQPRIARRNSPWQSPGSF